MKNSTTFRQFLYKNIYLLVLAAWLVTISFIVDNYWSANASLSSVQKKVSQYVHSQENDFNNFLKDTASLNKIEDGSYRQSFLDKLTKKKYFLFFYTTDAFLETELKCWSSQQVLPPSYLLYENADAGFIQLRNGYYVWNKYKANHLIAIALVPVKWNYIISNEYLQNGFANDETISSNYDISLDENEGYEVKSIHGENLFSLYQKSSGSSYKDNIIAVWLRIFSGLLILMFIHLCASFIVRRKNLLAGVLVFFFAIFILRVLGYYYPIPLNFRQFELFDPSIYGSNIILRSLGDLLINALFFVWFVLFVRHHLHEKEIVLRVHSKPIKWMLLGLGSFILLLATYTGSYIIRSLIADSQISFDVINFFTLNIYSVIGFIILSSLAIGYYFLCQSVLYLLKPLFSKVLIPLFLFVAIAGLALLSFRVGKIAGGFELYVLMWLLFFLFFLNSSYLNLLASRIISSKLVFWLFFFSVSITAIIIVENNGKELRNRKHYAEILATKADPLSETLINSMLTDFREDFLAKNFYRFSDEGDNHFFKDSLINGNFSGYTDKYETKIFSFTSDEKPLFNKDSADYNKLNTILISQGKSTSVSDLFYYDEAYDKFSYISKKVIKDTADKLLGYVFILATPKKFKSDALYPELFSKGHNNSIENSSVYAFAVYNNGKLVSSHNDYPFATVLKDQYLKQQQFVFIRKKEYNELWYNAGGGKMTIIAKENSVSIESITLFSYLFCSFLLITAFFWLINILVRSAFNIKKLRSYWQLTIRNQIHGTIIFISVISFFVIGVATILFFINRYQNNNREKLSQAIHIMENEVKNTIANGFQLNDSLNSSNVYRHALEQTINRISEIHGVDVNLYDVGGDLKISSLPLPYDKGIVSTKMDPMAYFHLNNEKEIQYFQQERIGKLDFVSSYVPVIDVSGNNYAYLNIPYFTSESKLKEEIANFMVTIINLNAFIFLIAGIVALFITNRITRSFSLVSERMKKINLGQRNEAIEWNRNDELGDLVIEYNKMVNKLDDSAEALAKTEREGAWREMAKQVAHEIKNPLTPMKLSMQFLLKSIEQDMSNVKELTANVAKTLVEQIDHLSQIASEFSQFANIENSKIEIFDINDLLKNVLNLYASNDQLELTEFLLPQQLWIEADKTHINRLFTNLVQNALQAVPEGRIAKVSIRETVEKGELLIVISDNGQGIPEEIRSKIFVPNFTTKTSGTGLGLAISKRIVEQANGSIWFETSIDKGSSFFVKLPLISN